MQNRYISTHVGMAQFNLLSSVTKGEKGMQGEKKICLWDSFTGNKRRTMHSHTSLTLFHNFMGGFLCLSRKKLKSLTKNSGSKSVWIGLLVMFLLPTRNVVQPIHQLEGWDGLMMMRGFVVILSQASQQEWQLEIFSPFAVVFFRWIASYGVVKEDLLFELACISTLTKPPWETIVALKECSGVDTAIIAY